MQYYMCPFCQSNLDPGERCDCRDERDREQKERQEALVKMQVFFRTEENGQMSLAV